MPEITIPDVVPYLFAILGLLLVWQLHEIQVRAGRIAAVDFWERSGIRMFIHVTPNDAIACQGCREASGKVFPPETVASKGFQAQNSPCTNPGGCRCQLVGLYGGWPEAVQVQTRLKEGTEPIRLSDEELSRMLDGARERTAGASADRISIHMLRAMRAESTDPAAAVDHYRYVLDHAREARDLAFVAPAYLRVSELLERMDRPAEALVAVEKFFKAWAEKKLGPTGPTEANREMMASRKTRLETLLRQSGRRTDQAVTYHPSRA
jgi:hypothetical protein